MARSLGDRADLDFGSIQGGVEQREPLGLALDLLERRGARQEHHLVGNLCGGDPDLLTVHPVTPLAPFRAGLELRRVDPCIRLRARETDLLYSPYDRRHPSLLPRPRARPTPPLPT